MAPAERTGPSHRRITLALLRRYGYRPRTAEWLTVFGFYSRSIPTKLNLTPQNYPSLGRTTDGPGLVARAGAIFI